MVVLSYQDQNTKIMRNSTRKQSVWWREHRKRLYKPNVRNMSIETVLRMNFKKTSREYLENCSLAGVQRISDRDQTIKQRIVRIVLFCVMLGLIVYFLRNLWFENLVRPLIVTMESSTYPISNIEFPAVTLCNFNRISKKALRDYVQKNLTSMEENKEQVEDIISLLGKQLGRLVDYSYNKTLQSQPLLFSFGDQLGDSRNIIHLMEKLAPQCADMLVRCAWAGEVVDCRKIFTLQRTVHGHCCAFNVAIGDWNTTEGLRFGRSIYTIKRQHRPGHSQGLIVILDAMIDDYTYTTFNMLGFEVLIYDATHFADHTGGSMIQRTAQPGQAVFFEIHATKQIATPEVRKYPPQTRKCLFRDEMKDQFFNYYSYSACIVRCRIRTVKSLCKCTPYYFPSADEDDPICTLDHLKCLNRYKEKLFYLFPKDAVNTEGLEAELQDALYCAECLPDCELTRHHSKHSKIPLIYLADPQIEHQRFLFQGLNMTGKCLLSIYQATTDGVLNRLDIVLYWFEIVSNVGGFCGILIGFSLISIVEFLYFLVFRYLWNLYHIYYN